MKKVHKKSDAVADLETKIVHRVHTAGGLSRTEFARALQIVASTSGIYVDRLVADQWLTEKSGIAPRGLGRPPVLLQLNPRVGRFIGVDFDARQIQGVAVDFTQQPLAEVRRVIPARCEAEDVLELIAEVVQQLIGKRNRELLGIGLGVPGPVDPAHGVSIRYAFLKDWRDVPIGPWMARRFQVPVSIENNLRSMALAEMYGHAGRSQRHLICLGVRSGIGSGILVDGRLLTGAHNLAGEIGHWIFPSSANDARPSTIEDLASMTALLASARLTQTKELLARLEKGESRIEKLVAAAARVHAWTANQLITLFDPQRLVIAGPLVESRVYRGALVDAASHGGGDTLRQRLKFSDLGPFSAARGAAAVAFQNWRPQR